MAMVDVVSSSLQAGLRLNSVVLVQSWQPCGAVLHSLREPVELSQ